MAQLSGQFVCPQCQELLRVQEFGRSEIEWNCPTCGTLLLISRSEQHGLQVRIADDLRPQFDTPDLAIWKKNVPLFIGAGAIVLFLVGLGIYWQRNLPANSDTASRLAEQNEDHAEPERNPQEMGPAVPHRDQEVTPPAQAEETDPFAQKLAAIAGRVNQYRKDNGQFPSAIWNSTRADSPNGFSWLAGFDPALETDQSLFPQWNLPWDDPLNDRFVRRRREDLLNPTVRQLASPDRYPASHIVGISGLGPDAANLPTTDPRAGVFGWNRVTEVDDVVDGLNNTMLAAGVTDKLHSWADGAGGIRSFEQTPYINGPDHFGTGDPAGMFVLLADGSVRFLSKKTEPRVIEKLAAMADSQQLVAEAKRDNEENTKTTKSHANEPAPRAPDPENSETESPVDQDMAQITPAEPEVPPIDFSVLLEGKKVSYQLVRPAPLDYVLAEVEALLGARIEFDEQTLPKNDSRRQEPVAVTVEDATLKQLLNELLDKAKMTYRVEPQKLVVLPAE